MANQIEKGDKAEARSPCTMWEEASHIQQEWGTAFRGLWGSDPSLKLLISVD